MLSETVEQGRGELVVHEDAVLSCPRTQAERVLTSAERRGLVVPTAAASQWKTTPLGRQLAFHWKPPPRIEPAIALDDKEDSKAINEMFDDVPCSILRTTPDDDDAFEEASLEVGVFVDYASPRVIEISVSIPDDYDHPESSASIESSVYIGVDDARRFAKALQTAIERAESELARRAKLKPRKSPPTTLDATPSAKKRTGLGTVVVKGGASATPKSPAALARAAAKADAVAETARRKAEREAEHKRTQEQRALSSTLKELGGHPKRPRRGTS